MNKIQNNRAPLFFQDRHGVRCIILFSLTLVTSVFLTACAWNKKSSTGQDSVQKELARLPSVSISAREGWVDSEVFINEGDLVDVSASGNWSETQDGMRGPEGGLAGLSGGGYWQQTRMVPLAPWGALIGKIGESSAFALGARARFVATASGPLKLSINDVADAFEDNTGAVQVRVLTREVQPGFNLEKVPRLPQ